jgi:hypothetical protein
MWLLQYSFKAFHGNYYVSDINCKELKMLMSFKEHQTSKKRWETNVTFKPWTKYSKEVHIECSNGRPKAWSTAVKVGTTLYFCYCTQLVLFCLICVPAISMHPTHISQAPTKRTLYVKWLYAQSSLKSQLNMNTKIALMTVIHTFLQHK